MCMCICTYVQIYEISDNTISFFVNRLNEFLLLYNFKSSSIINEKLILEELLKL